MNTVYVLWLRQMKRISRSRFRLAASLSQPLLFLVAFGLGFGQIFQRAGQGSYIQFFAPGLIVMPIMFLGLFSGADMMWDRRFGFLKMTLVAPVSRLALLMGRTAGGATVSILGGLLLALATAIVGFRPAGLAASALGLAFMLLTACLFTAWGMALASAMEDFQAYQLFINYMAMPMFYLSGAFFPLNFVPKPLRILALFNPFAYAVDGMRASLGGAAAHFSITTDLGVLAGLSALFILLGARLFARIQV
ncbi:MAG: ABC transporter permease [Acidobacteriia bacterium]|nr:ABC transporter permease [Terriglobia bacterium]